MSDRTEGERLAVADADCKLTGLLVASCAHCKGIYSCGHVRCEPYSECQLAGPGPAMTASTADGTLTVRQCTCSFTWGTDGLGHVTEVRRPGLACPTHPLAATP